MQPQQESTAGGRARKKELATRHLAHSQPSFLAVAGLRAARLMGLSDAGIGAAAANVPDNAWSISVSVGAGIFASSAAAAMIWPDWQ